MTNPYAPPAAPLDAPGARAESAGFKSLRGLSNAVVVVLGLSVVVLVVHAAVTPRPLAGIVSSKSLGLIARGLSLVGWILLCFVMPRANRNARLFAGDEAFSMRYRPRQTVVVFFIPFVNLWGPYQAVKEIWQRSDPDPFIAPSEVHAPLVAWWWGVFLLSSVGTRLASYILKGGFGPLDPIQHQGIVMLTHVLPIAAALIAAFMVRSLANRQDLRQQRRRAQPF
jgi:hypothetical protein